jgi:CBS domain-containing protein
MKTCEHYVTEVASARPETTVRALSELMTHYGIGCVVIRDEERRPLGVVTDRDLACRVVARGLDPDATTAEAVATKPVHCADTDDSLEQVIARMRAANVRRMPVVRDAALVGLVTLDDLVVHLVREAASLSAAATTSIDASRRAGRRTRRRAELEESVAALEASAIAAGREAMELVSREFDALRERFWRSSD